MSSAQHTGGRQIPWINQSSRNPGVVDKCHLWQMLSDPAVHQTKCQRSFVGIPDCCCLYLLFAHIPGFAWGWGHSKPPFILKDFVSIIRKKWVVLAQDSRRSNLRANCFYSSNFKHRSAERFCHWSEISQQMALAAFEDTLESKQTSANESFVKLFSSILEVDRHVSALRWKKH